jgi:HTH-type transcriptional regulator, quorum sensing regulator NprR
LKFMTEEEKSKVTITWISKAKASESVEELEQIIEHGRKLDCKDILIAAYESMGERYYNENNFALAFTNYYEALEICHTGQIKEPLAMLYNRLGKCKLKMLEYHEALSFFTKAYGYASENEDKLNRNYILFNLALGNKKLGNTRDAIYFISEYISSCDQQKERTDYLDGIMLRINCYFDNEEYGIALMQYKDLLQIISEDESVLKVYIYHNMGLIYFYLKQFEEAIEFLDRAIELRKEMDQQVQASLLIDKAQILLEQKKHESALELLEQGLLLAKRHNDYQYMIKGFTLLEEVYSLFKDTGKLESVYMNLLEVIIPIREYKEQCFRTISKLALIQIKLGKIEESKETLEKSITL